MSFSLFWGRLYKQGTFVEVLSVLAISVSGVSIPYGTCSGGNRTTSVDDPSCLAICSSPMRVFPVALSIAHLRSSPCSDRTDFMTFGNVKLLVFLVFLVNQLVVGTLGGMKGRRIS